MKKFTLFTHVIHGEIEGQFFAYEPYVREMNLWFKYVSNVTVVAPLKQLSKSPIHDFYQHENIVFKSILRFDFTSFKNSFQSIILLPSILWIIFKEMKVAEHIHIRCPGNVGLLACIVQIFFPNKIKSAKYAGNWDLNAKQPLSYRVQKWILNNSFLTRNMTVLVYGEWGKSSKNILPFFTATYHENEKIKIDSRKLTHPIQFIFVGTLTVGKQPMYAVKIIENLLTKGYNCTLNIFGEGKERNTIEEYIQKNSLTNKIELFGNQSKDLVKKMYQKSHFVILPSKSEGWPKVIAEGMFWGCFPIATKVSCLSNMLNNGERGVLLEMNLEKDVFQIEKILLNEKLYQSKVDNAINWSRKYTIEFFEDEIKKLI